MRKLLLAVTLVLTVLAASTTRVVHAETVYRWVDGAGTVHYSERPHKTYTSTPVQVRASSGGITITEQAAAETESGTSDEMAEYCTRASDKYATLTQTERRIRTRDEYGNERVLTDEEIASAAATQQEAMDKYCQ